jgi:hypothetical protein
MPQDFNGFLPPGRESIKMPKDFNGFLPPGRESEYQILTQICVRILYSDSTAKNTV